MNDNNINKIYDWHAMPIDEVLKHLKTKKTGLSFKKVEERKQKYGLNVLPIKKHPTFFKLLILQFINPLIFILIGATIASLLINELMDALFIIIVIFLDAILGAYQEWNAEKSVSSLHSIIKIMTKVRREEKEYEIDSPYIVPGDIILIESGDKIPADIRLITATNLTVDESFLTGESTAIEKKVGVVNIETDINEQTNMCFAGSSVLTGRAVGVVIATALQTEVGKIAENVIKTKVSKPPLVIRMENFTRQITILVLIMGFVLSIILHFKGYASSEIFFLTVALAVSTIPEGLPVVLTVALSIATSRMLKNNVLVRKLTAVESLGSCTVIASDKTGTLTVNQQTVKMIQLPDNAIFSVSGEGYNGIGKVKAENKIAEKKGAYEQLLQLSKVTILTNEAMLEKDKDEWLYHGDYIDVALLSLGYKLNLEPSKIRNEHQLLGSIPYESENKYAASFYVKDDCYYVGVKGAVETILPLCSYMATATKIIPIDPNLIEKQAYNLSKEGYRVLAVASSSLDEFIEKDNYHKEDIPDLIFLGLIAFIDPIRPQVKEAIKKCHQAGIKVIMITGDHPTTAVTIAKSIGLLNENEIVITGAELSKVKENNQNEFDQLVKDIKVFARISPMQKLEIIDSLKRQGEFVAVTGDGVNDAPALRSANIGVAMGSGSDVARETSSMIITDDNFLSIVAGIEEGRIAYDNVRKVIYLLISNGAAEVFLFIFAILTNLPLPLLAVQLLWLNLVTDGIQDVALAFEGGEPGTMLKKPRHPSEKIFNQQMIEQTMVSGLFIGLTTSIFWYYLIKILTIDINEARNYLLLLMVFMQNIHVLNCRSETNSTFKIPLKRNKILVFGILTALLLHLSTTIIPFMQPILHTSPISFKTICSIFIIALPLLFVMEGYKLIKRRK